MPQEEYDHLLKLVQDRRTIRQFRPDPIPKGSIEKIIDVARWAPSGFHTQPWEFVVIQKKEVKEAVIKILDTHAPPITNPQTAAHARTSVPRSFRDAPAFILLLADWRAMVGLPGHPTEPNELIRGIYQSGLASAFLYMHLAATSLGLAAQWYTSATRPDAEREIRTLIGFPDSLTIYDMMVLGYPEAAPHPKELRSLDSMIHYNACGAQDFRTDEQVIADAEKTWAWCLSQH